MINDTDINKIVVSKKILCKNKISNISLVTNLSCIFSPRMSMYIRDIDEAKCLYCLIKDLKFFDKCNET